MNKQLKSYLITDPAYYDDLESFDAYLHKIFRRHTPDFVCFRDKQNETIEPYARHFLEAARRYGISRTLINHEIALAVKLGFWGLHLTSAQHERVGSVSRRFFTVVSTHTVTEALAVQERGADAVTLSPIFASPGKGEGRGPDFLCEATRKVRKAKIFALGGIVSEKEIRKIARCAPYGFASIRYFV